MLVAEDLGLLVLGQLAQEGVGLAQQQVDQEPEHFLKTKVYQEKLLKLLRSAVPEVYGCGYSDSS